MELKELIQSLDSDGHKRLQEIVALGRWPDGRALSSDEREGCLQALIAYEAKLPESERTGYIAQRCQSASDDQEVVQTVEVSS